MKRCSRRTFPRPPVRLALANHMDRLVAGDRTPSAPERPEMLTCTNPAFDGPMVLFQDVIKILYGSVLAVFLQNTAGFELSDGWRIGGVLVGINYPRRRMVLPRPRIWSENAPPLLHHVWPREGSRSSHRWSPPRGINTPTCP